MCSYNSVDGKPACANPRLLEDILRKQWGFQGYVVSDCGAIADIYLRHKFVAHRGRRRRARRKSRNRPHLRHRILEPVARRPPTA